VNQCDVFLDTVSGSYGQLQDQAVCNIRISKNLHFDHPEIHDTVA